MVTQHIIGVVRGLNVVACCQSTYVVISYDSYERRERDATRTLLGLTHRHLGFILNSLLCADFAVDFDEQERLSHG